MLRLVITSMIAFLFAGQLAWGASITVDGRTWEEFNGHWYSLTFNHGSWDENEAEAVAVGGHLVTINDVAENLFVAEFADLVTARNDSRANARIVWIGLIVSPGPARWISGEPVTFNNFLSAKTPGPHVFINEKSYVSAESTGPFPGDWGNNILHDVSFNNQLRGVIERNTSPTVVPLPVAAWMGLALLGGLGGIHHISRRRPAA